tara:strand:+ start:468 stop:581 length:114 start_codon:yes stop_codon:yes gene_type:complete
MPEKQQDMVVPLALKISKSNFEKEVCHNSDLIMLQVD